MSNVTMPTPIIIPRHITGPAIENLKLPLNVLGAPLVAFGAGPVAAAAAQQWWNSRPIDQQKSIRECLAILAGPHLLADVRTFFQQKNQMRTCALAGGKPADAPWMFLAPINDDKEYHLQLSSGRDIVANSCMTYLSAGMPIWDSGIGFTCGASEFAVLIALADAYSRSQYAALLLHEPYPESLPSEQLLDGYEDVTRNGDQRFLFPAIAHLLPEEARSIGRDSAAGIISRLVEIGLMTSDGKNIGWTDGGLFFVDSLHRRICAVALDIAGATAAGALATQGALFIRGDQTLWYCDIEPHAAGKATVVSIGAEKAALIMNEILTPVGAPPAYQKAAAGKRVAASKPASSVTRSVATSSGQGPVAHRVATATPQQATPSSAQQKAVPAPQRAATQSTASMGAKRQSTGQPPAGGGATAKPHFCRSCGAQLKPGARFCAKCGTQA